MKKEKVVCVLSGGIDSSTLLAKLSKENKEIHAITFEYGQRHNKEIEYATKIANFYHIKSHSIVNIPIFSNSSLTQKDKDIPEGHYKQDNMKQTVVPNRNMIMLSVAASYAETLGIKKVYYGAHHGDHTIYWDCRDNFVKSMDNVLKLNEGKVRICAPFMWLDKGDIVCLGKALEVPYQITWTCYKGEKKACGKCGSCVERLEAFKKAKLEDPIEYE